MADAAPSKLGPRGLILALAGIAAVALGFVVWKNAQRESARAQLANEFGAMLEQDPNGEGLIVGLGLDASHSDLSELAPLLKKANPISVLDLTGSPELQSFAGIESLESLEGLIAMSCPKLTDISGVAGLTFLRELVLADATALQSADSIRNLPALEALDLSGTQLSEFAIAGLPRMMSLFLSNVPAMKQLDLGGGESLRQAFLDGCRGLEKIKGLDGAVNLTDLDVSSCHRLKNLEGLAALKTLQVLDLRNALEISNFDEIGEVESLMVLRLGGHPQLEDLTLVSRLTGLSELHIEGCENLASLKGLPASLSNYAGFTHCPSLTGLEGVEAARELRQLDLGGCKALSDITALRELKQLTELNLGGCRAVTDASVLGELDNIAIVQLGGSGVPPASIKELKKEKPDVIFDFTGG